MGMVVGVVVNVVVCDVVSFVASVVVWLDVGVVVKVVVRSANRQELERKSPRALENRQERLNFDSQGKICNKTFQIYNRGL